MKRIIYLSLVPLDSPKAYVVTIDNTAEALTKLGYQISYLGPLLSLDSKLHDYMQIENTFYSCCSSFLYSFIRFKFISRLIFNLHRTLVSFYVLFRLSSFKHFSFWTRDTKIACLLSRMGLQVACEIHQELTTSELISIRLSNPNKIAFFPISRYLDESLSIFSLQHHMSLQIFRLPVAVREDFFASPKDVLFPSNSSKIVIGYFGSYESVNTKSNLEDFIKMIANITSLSFTFMIVGINDIGKRNIEDFFSRIKNSNLTLEFVERVAHKQVPILMSKCHVFVIPYGDDGINKGRFPIKALEYAAANRPILCNSSQNLKDIFDNSEVFFFSYDEPFNLERFLHQVAIQSPGIKQMTAKAQLLARRYSYMVRAEKLADFFG